MGNTENGHPDSSQQNNGIARGAENSDARPDTPGLRTMLAQKALTVVRPMSSCSVIYAVVAHGLTAQYLSLSCGQSKSVAQLK